MAILLNLYFGLQNLRTREQSSDETGSGHGLVLFFLTLPAGFRNLYLQRVPTRSLSSLVG